MCVCVGGSPAGPCVQRELRCGRRAASEPLAVVSRDARHFVPLFRSPDSYMSLALPQFVVPGRTLGVELQFRALSSSNGLLLYTGQTDSGRGDYLSLAVVDNTLQLRYSRLLLSASVQRNVSDRTHRRVLPPASGAPLVSENKSRRNSALRKT